MSVIEQGGLVGAPGPLREARRRLSSAEMLVLDDAAVEIVAAPGDGKIVAPETMILAYHAGDTAFTGTPTYDINVGTTRIARTNANGFTTTTTDAVRYYRIAATFGAYPINANINLSSSAAVTAGTGEMEVILLYRIIDIGA